MTSPKKTNKSVPIVTERAEFYQGRELGELARNQCHFPVSAHEARHHTFCGERAAPGRPYCHSHMQLCYTGPAGPRASKDVQIAVESEA
jgi:hypothetical protein